MVTTDSSDKLRFGGGAVPSQPSCEPIFPSELRSRVAQPLELPGKAATWFRWVFANLTHLHAGGLEPL